MTIDGPPTKLVVSDLSVLSQMHRLMVSEVITGVRREGLCPVGLHVQTPEWPFRKTNGHISSYAQGPVKTLSEAGEYISRFICSYMCIRLH